MKSKIRTLSIALILVVSLVLVSGCTPSVQQPQQVDPCKVELAGVDVLFVGKDSCSFNQVFSISNPNSIDVVLENFEYRTSVGDQVIALGNLNNNVYIPANKEVKISAPFIVVFGALVGKSFMDKGMENVALLPESMQGALASGQVPEAQAQGMVQLAAMLEVMPLWKSLGGKLSIPIPDMAPLLQGVWDAAPEETAVFVAEGEALISSTAGELEFGYLTQWQAPS